MKFILYASLYTLVLLCSLLVANGQDFQKIDSLKMELSLVSDDKTSVDILLQLTDEFIKNNPEESLSYANLALEKSQKTDYQRGIVKAKNNIAKVYLSKTELNKALEYAESAREIAKVLEFNEELITAYSIIGYVYKDLGVFDRSSEYFFKSLKLSELLKNEKLIANSLNSIGFVYFDQQNYNKALEYYLKSLEISKNSNDAIGIARGYNNVVAAKVGLKDFSGYETYMREAISINIETGNYHWLSVNYKNLGDYYHRTNKMDSAMFYAEKALKVSTDVQNIAMVTKVKMLMARQYLHLGDTDKSLVFAHEAFKNGKELGLKKTMHAAALLLKNIYLAKQDISNAYKFDTTRLIIKDSLNINDNLTELTKLELQYSFDKREKELQLKQQRKDFLMIITVICLVSGLLVILLLFIRYRIKSRYVRLENKKLEDEIEFKNKELTLNVMSLMKKNELLSEFSQKLVEVEKTAVKEETKAMITNIAQGIDKTTQLQLWEEFELRFKQVHTDFYNKLNKEFPDLSPSEQRLCAFLRLNMTSKDISEITGQSTKTLEMARFRLRKKLGISGRESNLISFISKI